MLRAELLTPPCSLQHLFTVSLVVGWLQRGWGGKRKDGEDTVQFTIIGFRLFFVYVVK